MPARARACCAAANAGVRPQALGGGRERWGARRAGAFLPFTSREDVDFFSHLEMHLRQEFPPLSGRDHLAYRSSYFPVKDVVDGDLCEQFSQMPADKQRAVAEELERTPGEVLKKLEDLRNALL